MDGLVTILLDLLILINRYPSVSVKAAESAAQGYLYRANVLGPHKNVTIAAVTAMATQAMNGS